MRYSLSCSKNWCKKQKILSWAENMIFRASPATKILPNVCHCSSMKILNPRSSVAERERTTFFNRMKNFFEQNGSRFTNGNSGRTLRTRSSTPSTGRSKINRSSSSSNRSSVTRSKSSSSNSRSRGSSSSSRSRSDNSSSSSSDRSRGN